MPGPAFLHGDRVVLRTRTDEDEAVLLSAYNDPVVRDGLLHDRPRGPGDLDGGVELPTAREDVRLLVCVDGEIAGEVSLFGFQHDNAALSYWLLPAHRGRGYATEAARLVLAYGFDTLGLHHVTAGVIEYNEASQAVLERLGFALEGRCREHRFRRGRYCDLLQYGLLESEWREHAARGS